MEPVLSLLRNTQALKVTFTTRDNSSYARLLDQATFWYQAGFTSDIDSDESRYAASSFDHQETISLATSMRLRARSRWISSMAGPTAGGSRWAGSRRTGARTGPT